MCLLSIQKSFGLEVREKDECEGYSMTYFYSGSSYNCEQKLYFLNYFDLFLCPKQKSFTECKHLKENFYGKRILNA